MGGRGKAVLAKVYSCVTFLHQQKVSFLDRNRATAGPCTAADWEERIGTSRGRSNQTAGQGKGENCSGSKPVRTIRGGGLR